MSRKKQREVVRDVVALNVDRAPDGFNCTSEQWMATPKECREYVWRRMIELKKGMAKYQAVAEPLEKFHEMALQTGTTIDQALEKYIAWHRAWLTDPVQTFFASCAAVDADPRQVLSDMQKRLVDDPSLGSPVGKSALFNAAALGVAKVHPMFGGTNVSH